MPIGLIGRVLHTSLKGEIRALGAFYDWSKCPLHKSHIILAFLSFATIKFDLRRHGMMAAINAENDWSLRRLGFHGRRDGAY